MSCSLDHAASTLDSIWTIFFQIMIQEIMTHIDASAKGVGVMTTDYSRNPVHSTPQKLILLAFIIYISVDIYWEYKGQALLG